MVHKVNDFFCGAGGMGLGFHKAGFEVTGAWDFDKYAVQSYKHNLSDVVEQGDISKLTWENVPKADVWTFGFPCFVPGTLVLTEEGHKPIEVVQKGDRVLTHKNRYKEVVTPMMTEANHVYRIQTMAGEDLLVTEEHPFYVREFYGKESEHRLTEPKWVKAKDLSTRHYAGVAINQKAELPQYSEACDAELTKCLDDAVFWRMVGYGVGASLKPTIDKTNKISYISSRVVSRFLHKSGTKQVPSEVLNLPRHLLASFLDGLFEVGGVTSPAGLHIIEDSDKEWVYGIGACVAKAYQRPYEITRTKSTRTGDEGGQYQLTFNFANCEDDLAFYEDGYIWSPIQGVTKEAYQGPVYNFEVADDNSYTVQNIIVHNCQDISIAGKQKGMVKGETRSGMFYEIMRLLKETTINDPSALPSLLLAENVKAVRKLLPEIEKEYEEHGYKMYARMYNSKHFGVPQSRERYFIVGVHKSINTEFAFPEEQTETTPKLSEILETTVDERFYISKEKAHTVIKQAMERVELVDTHACLTPERVTKRQAGRRAKSDEEAMYTLTSQDRHGVIDVVGLLDIKGQDNVRRVYNPKGVSPTLTTSEGGNRQPKVVELLPPEATEDAYTVLTTEGVGVRVRKLTPREYARLQGFPDDYEQIVSNSQFYKQMGNAVTVNVSKAIAEQMDAFLTFQSKDTVDAPAVNDFFCGAGGMGLGFQQSGFTVSGAWDIDEAAVKSYAHNIGTHANQTDLSSASWKDIPKADVWSFGFPCQSVSIAGKREGMVKGKTKSGMFYDIMRLLEETELHRPENMPALLMAENVKAVKKYLPAIEEEYRLRGYDMHVHLYNSNEFGVPQSRERYFIVGVRSGRKKPFVFPASPETVVPIQQVLEDDVAEKWWVEQEKTEKFLREYSKQSDNPKEWVIVDDTYGYGGTRFYEDYTPTVRASRQGIKILNTHTKSCRRITPLEYARLQGFPDSYEQIVSDTQFYKQMGNAVTVSVARCIAEAMIDYIFKLRETKNEGKDH